MKIIVEINSTEIITENFVYWYKKSSQSGFKGIFLRIRVGKWEEIEGNGYSLFRIESQIDSFGLEEKGRSEGFIYV
jgi:hypothetical protein